MQAQSTELVKVPFHGDVIEAVKTEGGKIMVSLKRVCESLGVDVEGQRKKLAGCPWATTVMISAVADDGKRRQLAMIDHETLPMWLTTIHPSKVKASIREKLVQYQCEAKAVLAAWFLGSSADLPALAAEFAEVKTRLAKLEEANFAATLSLAVERERVRVVEAEVDDARQKLGHLLRPFGQGCVDYMTIRDYCTTYGVLNDVGCRLTSAEIRIAGRAAAAMSAALGIGVFKQETDLAPVNLYRLDVLQAWRAAYDLRTKLSEESFERVSKLIR